MTREKIYERLNFIFRNVFDDDGITVTDNTVSDDIEDWDSLMNINLMLAIESEFGLKIAMQEIVAFWNVSDIVDIILMRATK